VAVAPRPELSVWSQPHEYPFGVLIQPGTPVIAAGIFLSGMQERENARYLPQTGDTSVDGVVRVERIIACAT
jgi:hypothetical protein